MRLTKRDEFGNADIVGVESADLQLNLEFDELNKVTSALNKLAHYEDMEETGRLKIFPCSIGDTIWIPLRDGGRFTGKIVEDKVQMIGFTSKGIRIKARNHHAHNITLKLGEAVFLTKEAAEAALKEREKRRNGKGDVNG